MCLSRLEPVWYAESNLQKMNLSDLSGEKTNQNMMHHKTDPVEAHTAAIQKNAETGFCLWNENGVKYLRYSWTINKYSNITN